MSDSYDFTNRDFNGEYWCFLCDFHDPVKWLKLKCSHLRLIKILRAQNGTMSNPIVTVKFGYNFFQSRFDAANVTNRSLVNLARKIIIKFVLIASINISACESLTESAKKPTLNFVDAMQRFHSISKSSNC